MREIRLHDTRSGGLVPLDPRWPKRGLAPEARVTRLRSGRVGIYACGPTVYSRIHIGNARPYLVFSLLKRFLEHEGYGVTLVVNVTDVNDKIYDAARPDPSSEDPDRRTGRPSAELAAEMTAYYRADTDALGLGRPDHEPLASQTMDAIVDYISDLIDSGHAYESGGDVYFRVRSDPGYGSLSHRRVEDMDAMDQGEDDEGSADSGDSGDSADSAHSAELADRKQDPLDFALWKAHKPGEDTVWDSPWGPGRPGWHIECSAMAESLLGVGFDIHGGGSDLVFPHHENEAAQTRAARGEELARIWMHNGMIQLTGEKMAKSAGNIAPLHEVLERYGRDAVVMYLVSGHYRQPLAFGEDELEQAGSRVRRIRDLAPRLGEGDSPADMKPIVERFYDALADDFNTPAALAAMFEWVREANRRSGLVGKRDLEGMLDLVGLANLLENATFAPPQEVMRKLAQRDAARKARDFGAADRLRAEIEALGWQIKDGAAGAQLRPVDR
jgi:cysteinyl-tRNA synthetase